MKNLDVKGPQVSHVNKDSDPIVIALNKYVSHRSIFKRKEYFNEHTGCNFLEVILNDIKKEIKELSSSKMVHLKILLENLPKKHKVYVVRFYVVYRWKKLYEKGIFQRILKTQM